MPNYNDAQGGAELLSRFDFNRLKGVPRGFGCLGR